MGNDPKTRAAAERGVRGQIAFYGSTPSYRPVLELHGWANLGSQLNVLSRRQEWAQMGDLITDDVLDAFAVSGTADPQMGGPAAALRPGLRGIAGPRRCSRVIEHHLWKG